MNKVTMDKKYTTRDGRPVRILAVDVKNDTYSVAVVILNGNGVEGVNSFTSNGYYYNDGEECNSDLIEVAPFQKDDRVMVQHYKGGMGVRRYFSHMSRDMFMCFDDGGNSWSTNETTPWSICRAYNLKLDGE